MTIEKFSILFVISISTIFVSCSLGPPLITRTSSVDAHYLYLRESEKISSSSFLIIFYKNVLSKTLYSRCPMYPSCSKYSMLDQQKRGPLSSSIRTFSRLFGEVDANRGGYPLFTKDNHVYFLDLP